VSPSSSQQHTLTSVDTSIVTDPETHLNLYTRLWSQQKSTGRRAQVLPLSPFTLGWWLQVNAEVFLKATKVDGVYDSDPAKNPQARRYDRLSYRWARGGWSGGAQVVSNHLATWVTTSKARCMKNQQGRAIMDSGTVCLITA
jgi:hypothetical protein